MKEILGNGYLRRSVGGILLLKAKRFDKMYSKKTDARGILPNTFKPHLHGRKFLARLG